MNFQINQQFVKFFRVGVASSALAFVLERVVIASLNLFVMVFMVKNYEASLFGKWTYILTLTQLIAPLLGPGLETSIIKRSIGGNEKKVVIGSGAFLIFVMSLISSIILIFVTFFLYRSDVEIVFATIIISVANIFSFLCVFEYVLKSQLRSWVFVLPRMCILIIFALGKIYAISNGYSILTVASIFAIEQICTFVALYLCYRFVQNFGLRFIIQIKHVKDILFESWPIIASSLVIVLFFRANHLILANLVDFKSLGLYAVAFALIQALTMIPTALSSAIFPALVTKGKDNVEDAELMLSWTCYHFTVLAYLLLGLLYVFGDSFGDLLGNDYRASMSIIIALGFGMLFTFSGAARGMLINWSGNTKIHLYSALVGLLFLVAISIPLISKFGVVGAAYASAISYFISAIATSFAFPSLRKFGWLQLRCLILVPPAKGKKALLNG